VKIFTREEWEKLVTPDEAAALGVLWGSRSNPNENDVPPGTPEDAVCVTGEMMDDLARIVR
jgi:hypothetical protein